jgi:hypothetical protein
VRLGWAGLLALGVACAGGYDDLIAPPGEVAWGDVDPQGFTTVLGADRGLYLRDRGRLQYYDYGEARWEVVAVEPDQSDPNWGSVILGPVSGAGVYYGLRTGTQIVTIYHFDPRHSTRTRITTKIAGSAADVSMTLVGASDVDVGDLGGRVFRTDGSAYVPVVRGVLVGEAGFYADARGVVRQEGGADTVVVTGQPLWFEVCDRFLLVPREDGAIDVRTLEGAFVRRMKAKQHGRCAAGPATWVYVDEARQLVSERLEDGAEKTLAPRLGYHWGLDVHGRTAYVVDDGLAILSLDGEGW